MATNEIIIGAPRARVFAVLADHDAYGHWVVGAKEVRGEEGGWPAAGARFHHRVGVGPLTIADHSEVLEVVPDRRLKLNVRAQPLGRAHVLLELEAAGSATRVTMTETPADLKSRLVHNPVTDRLLHVRNTVSLRRLRDLAEPAPRVS